MGTGATSATALTIGQLAIAAHVNIETIRYYERRRLLPEPPRTRAGYRQYDEEAVRRVRFIKRAQDLGFTLKEIEELLALQVRHGAACDEVEERVRLKLIRVDEMITELDRVRTVLTELAGACRERRPTEECPILEVLDHDELTDE
ncbi:MAG: MerR family transcriptional regulator [Gemmatimonadales bacterium]|nr:MerR family transcriptional regulator [Gemmatimonadales bacterium]